MQRVLPLLREIGVIDYRTPQLRGPIPFRLLSVASGSPSVKTISPNVETNQKTASSPTIERTEKENIERKKKEQHATGGASSDHGFSESEDLCYEERIVRFYSDTLATMRNGWRQIDRRTQKLSQAIERAIERSGGIEGPLNTIRAVVEAPDSISLPKTKNLTRLLMDNPEGPEGWPVME